MKNKEKSKKELIAELKALLLRIEELEVIERKYQELTGQIAHLAGRIGAQCPAEPVTADVPRKENDRSTVLVVDDNDIARKFMQETLQRNGYRVYAAESAKEALHLLEKTGETVDLMVSDVIMPDGSGSELYRNVKAAHPHIKVLFVSGYADEILIHTDVQEVIESKVAFLKKPFHVSELIEKVKHELSKQ